MKLHEAIEEILKRNGKPMTTSEIAFELNRTKLYSRGDGGPIPASQVGARVKNYPQWFDKVGKYISPRKFSPSKGSIVTGSLRPVKKNAPNTPSFTDENLAAKVLLNEKNFKAASGFDPVVPGQSGLYAIRIKNVSALPVAFASELGVRKHNLLYIGIASQSLKKRLGQELRAKGHGTFFRSLGALLGYLPPLGCLLEKRNKRNYTFSPDDEQKIILWINTHLLVNWVTMAENMKQLETKLIVENRPLINIAKNPIAVAELKALRARCVEVATKGKLA